MRTNHDGRHRGPIVVGVDGSAATVRAVQWAAAEATWHNLQLRLVHGYVPPAFGYPPVIETKSLFDAHVEQARDWLKAAAARARAVAPGVDIRTKLRMTGPVPALKDESRQARLLVVGSRGTGGFPGMMLGSTAEALAGHAYCPVAVIPASPPVPAEAPVVVGVDGSAVSDAAIAVAFEAASMRNAPLVAVHAWSDQPMGDPFALLLNDEDWTEIEAAEQRLLAECMAGWQEKHPDVPVQRVLTKDRPVFALLSQAANAQLLVVGSHGRGGFTSMLLGSTSRAVLHRPPCPVIVVRPEQNNR